MKEVARKFGITVSVGGGKASVSFKGKEVAGGQFYDKKGTFMMSIKGVAKKFADATDVITYMVKNKLVEVSDIDMAAEMISEQARRGYLDEKAGVKSLFKKSGYEVLSSDSSDEGSAIDVTYKGKVIASGDFDRGPGIFFLTVPWYTKGQKGYRGWPKDIIADFIKNKYTG